MPLPRNRGRTNSPPGTSPSGPARWSRCGNRGESGRRELPLRHQAEVPGRGAEPVRQEVLLGGHHRVWLLLVLRQLANELEDLGHVSRLRLPDDEHERGTYTRRRVPAHRELQRPLLRTLPSADSPSTRRSKRGIAEALASLNPAPDIVCLQEVETLSLRSSLMFRRSHQTETQLESFMGQLEQSFERRPPPFPYDAFYFRAHVNRIGNTRCRAWASPSWCTATASRSTRTTASGRADASLIITSTVRRDDTACVRHSQLCASILMR